jgi:hypothetical protein
MTIPPWFSDKTTPWFPRQNKYPLLFSTNNTPPYAQTNNTPPYSQTNNTTIFRQTTPTLFSDKTTPTLYSDKQHSTLFVDKMNNSTVVRQNNNSTLSQTKRHLNSMPLDKQHLPYSQTNNTQFYTRQNNTHLLFSDKTIPTLCLRQHNTPIYSQTNDKQRLDSTLTLTQPSSYQPILRQNNS